MGFSEDKGGSGPESAVRTTAVSVVLPLGINSTPGDCGALFVRYRSDKFSSDYEGRSKRDPLDPL